MNNIIILLIIILIFLYFVFLYDLNNFIIDKFTVEENKCYSKNMDNLDVNMRSCEIYYTKNTSLCDNYPELYILSKNRLLNIINNPNNKNSVNINGIDYTMQVIKDVLNDKSKNNINSACSFKANKLYEIDNNLGDIKKYQKKIITNNISNNNNYLYSCFLPLDTYNITSNGLIDQNILDTYNTDNSHTPCIDDKKPITNIICHGDNCPDSNKFLAVNLNIMQKVNNNIIDIDDNLIFIKFKQTNYGIKTIKFESFVMYNRIKKIFETVDNEYIKNIINSKLFTFIYKNGKIYLTPRIINADVFTFIFNDNNNILFYDIMNNPFDDFSLKYLNINDIRLDNYNTSMTTFYHHVIKLAAYINSKTNETLLNNDQINYYIKEYNNIKNIEKEEAIKLLNNEISIIKDKIIKDNEKRKIELERCPANKNECWGDIYHKCNYKSDNSLNTFCINTVSIPCYYCNRNELEKKYNILLNEHNMILESKKNELNNIQNTPIDTTNNIYNLETYPGIFDTINLSQIMFNNAYINKFNDSLLSVDDNCIYINIPI